MSASQNVSYHFRYLVDRKQKITKLERGKAYLQREGDVTFKLILRVFFFLQVGNVCMAGNPFKLENRLDDVIRNS